MTGSAAPAATLTLRELNRATLARQMLLAREKTTVLRAVGATAGLQAQLARPPFIGLWSRLDGFQRADLTRLLHDRSVVRATLMRGTLHLVRAADYVSLRAAFQPMLHRGMQSVLRERAEGLDVDGLVAVARAFFTEAPRTFDALRDHLVALFPKGDERAMGYAVRMHLPLVQVPTETAWGYPGTSDFAVAESWLGTALAADGGVGPVVVWYLAAFGPASAADVQTWSGLASVREALDALRPKLRTFRDERGRELFDLPDAPRPPGDTAAPVRFLPEFDNLVLAHDDRQRLLDDAHRARIFRPGLRILPTFLVDGRVGGTWKVERAKKAATLVVEPFAALSRSVRQELTDEGDRLVRFIEDDAGTFAVRFAKP